MWKKERARSHLALNVFKGEGNRRNGMKRPLPMDSPVLLWVDVPPRTFYLGWNHFRQNGVPEDIHLGSFSCWWGRGIEFQGKKIVIKKVIAPQGVCGGGKGRFEARWGLFRQAVPMSCTPTGCTYLQAKSWAQPSCGQWKLTFPVSQG